MHFELVLATMLCLGYGASVCTHTQRMAAEVLLVSNAAWSLALCLGLCEVCQSSYSVSQDHDQFQYVHATDCGNHPRQQMPASITHRCHQDTVQVTDMISPNICRRTKSAHDHNAESKLHVVAILTDTCHTNSHSSRSRRGCEEGEEQEDRR